MTKAQTRFIARWFAGSFSLWIASRLLGSENVDFGGQLGAVVVSGFILALVNTFIRPLVVFLTLPAVLVTLGIFMVVINASMVLLAAWLYEPLDVSGFGAAIITGLVIGLVNWLVSAFLEEK